MKKQNQQKLNETVHRMLCTVGTIQLLKHLEVIIETNINDIDLDIEDEVNFLKEMKGEVPKVSNKELLLLLKKDGLILAKSRRTILKIIRDLYKTEKYKNRNQ